MLIRCWLPPESVPDLIVATIAEAGLLEHLPDRCLDVVDLLEPREQAQVLGHGQPPVERRLLGDEADLAAGEADLARIGLADAGEDREQRRLAGAVRADHREHLAGRGGEVDIVESEPVAEALRQPDRLDRGGRGVGSGR